MFCIPAEPEGQCVTRQEPGDEDGVGDSIYNHIHRRRQYRLYILFVSLVECFDSMC